MSCLRKRSLFCFLVFAVIISVSLPLFLSADHCNNCHEIRCELCHAIISATRSAVLTLVCCGALFFTPVSIVLYVKSSGISHRSPTTVFDFKTGFLN